MNSVEEIDVSAAEPFFRLSFSCEPRQPRISDRQVVICVDAINKRNLFNRAAASYRS